MMRQLNSETLAKITSDTFNKLLFTMSFSMIHYINNNVFLGKSAFETSKNVKIRKNNSPKEL